MNCRHFFLVAQMANNKQIPEIRFSGFTVAWEQRKLGKVVDVRSGKDYKHLQEGTIPVYGTGGYMLSVSEALSYSEDAIGIGRKGTIDKPYILKAPFWTVDTLFYAVPRGKYDLNFVFDIFQNINWKKKDESTGVPSLSKTAINEIDTLAPEESEQEAIGAFFGNLDDLITLHQRECDKLMITKKSMLKKMFPKNNEVVPEIRFSGFTDAWEQRKLCDVSSTFDYGLNAAAIKFDGENKYIRITDIDDQTHLFNTTDITSPAGDITAMGNYRLQEGDILFARTGASVGKTYKYKASDGVAYFAGFLIRIKTNDQFDPEFVFQNTLTSNYNRFIKITSQRSGQPGVNAQEYSQFEFMAPNYDEQQQIGAFFKNLDDLITLHQRELEKLNNIKKSMLEKMFV
jgi:type I restriction enzyme S subunit